MVWRITTTWGPNALPYEQRRNEDVEFLDESDWSHVPAGDPRRQRPMIELLGGTVRASMEDGGLGTKVLVEARNVR